MLHPARNAHERAQDLAHSQQIPPHPSPTTHGNADVWREGMNNELIGPGCHEIPLEAEYERLKRQKDEIMRAEIERLSKCLEIANKNHERFEREWYLRGDEIERLEAENETFRALLERLERRLADVAIGPLEQLELARECYMAIKDLSHD